MVDETIVGGPFVRYVPDPGTVFAVVEEVGETEYVRAYCPRILTDFCGTFTVGAFRRAGGDGPQNILTKRMEEEVVISETMVVYQVPQEDWMCFTRTR